MEQKKYNICNVKSVAALLVIALVAMFSLQGCGGKQSPSDITTDSLATPVEQDGGNHAEYEGISLDMSIDEFRKALEDEGYALGEKDPAHKMIKMYNQFEALWVYYDSETNKVWNVVNIDLHYEDMELGNEGDRRVYEILIPEYEQKYNTQHTGFCEGVDCIDIPGGCIIFAYDEILGGMIMTVDEANSNNYDNLADTTYGISPYGLED
ncbi:MAG: hypothetical protein IJP75_09695 [Bacteroidaceae bacterium]|nr:hypothetical protein [Bacteroidaceae bacterium]